MKLSRIRIEQFKQFRAPLEIRDLDAGINLFTGPNEAGKSTIVEAIRAAFFERHRSSSVDDLRPWGDSSASPTVELEFSLNGTEYRLTKSYLGKRRCELQAGARKMDGALAEDHLAELFGYQYAGKGASAAQHWGIPGLLWIQQGTGQEIRDSVANATDHLRSALNESLGEVASSGGDDVMAIVEERRNELLTPVGGAPRGLYGEALKRCAELDATIKTIDASILTYRSKVDLLGELRREHAADEVERPWVAFRQKEQEARERLAAIERVQASLAEDRKRAGQLSAQVALLRGQIQSLTDQEAMAVGRANAAEEARVASVAANALVEQWLGQARAAGADYESARIRLRQARQEDTRASLARQLEDLTRKAGTAEAALEKAEQEQATLLELQSQAAALQVDEEILETLRKQHTKIRELQIRRAAAATTLRFDLEGGSRIRIGDDEVAGSGERLLLESTTVQLPALGRLQISPGGRDLVELGRQERVLSDQHLGLLQQLGLESLEAVEERHQTYTRKAAEKATAAATIKALAPKGIEALKGDVGVQRAKAEEVEGKLKKLPDAPTDAAEVPSISEAEVAEEAKRQAVAQINASLSQAQIAAGNANTEYEVARKELESAQAILNAPDRATRLSSANGALMDALAEAGTLTDAMSAKVQAVARARPDLLKQDIDRFKSSAEQLERCFEERKTALLRLEVELEGAGAQGLEERRAEWARDLTQMQRRVEELRRRAAALDFLLDMLKGKRIALTRKLQAPLQRHLDRYLEILFPQAHLEIDENLTPGPLTRTGASGPESGEFDALSFGAREQMGLISRIAYADLLQAAGRPTLVILDDVLVHSDEARLARMKRVLFDAATRHQILLFTCHPGNWRDVGVSARSLSSVRA